MSVTTITQNTSPLEDLSLLDSPTLVTEAKYLIELIELNWKKGKKYEFVTKANLPIKVPTYLNSKLNSEVWHARSFDFTEFGDPLKDHYHKLLLKYVVGSTTDLTKTHTEYEQAYIHNVTHYEVTPFTLPGSEEGTHLSYLAQVYYKFPFPVKNRVFYELIHIYKPLENEAYVISLNVHKKNFERPGLDVDFATGRYTSIEKVSFDPETKSLKWTMATCLNAGGSIPSWMGRLKISLVIAEDVPAFINWVDAKEGKKVNIHAAAAAPVSEAPITLPPAAAPVTQTEVPVAPLVSDNKTHYAPPLGPPGSATATTTIEKDAATGPSPSYTIDVPVPTGVKN